MPDNLDRIAAALAAAVGELDARMVADAVWLAATAPPLVQGTSDHSDELPRDRRERDDTRRRESTAPREMPLTVPLSERRVSGVLVRGIPVRVPVPPPLPQAAAMARALRPFTRLWLQGTATQLDVDATVDHYAEHQVLTPVMCTSPERWFDVVMVVDDAPTMAVWRDTVTDFIRVFDRAGFFRAVHRWSLTDDHVKDHLGRTVTVADAAAMARVPNARRLVLVISDFAEKAWRGPALWKLVRSWASAAPVALVDPLPVRFWQHSGLDLPAVRVTATGFPGTTSTLHFSVPLRVRLAGESWLPVPVLTLTPAALDRWARTIVRADPDGCDAVLVPTHWTERSSPPASPGAAAEGFLRTAAAPAVRLALLSAPFEHFSLLLLRLLHANAVPEAELTDLAELLISGLATIDDRRAANPVLTYHPAARDHLLNHVTEDDVWTAHQALTSFIAAHPDLTSSMVALAHTPEGQEALPAEVRSFAAATTETLRLLGVVLEDRPALSGASIRDVASAQGRRSTIRGEEPEQVAIPSPAGRAPGGVFISQRGVSTRKYGDLLHRELVRRFGADLVFSDLGSMPAAEDYAQELLSRVRSAGVVLAVIGRDWLNTADRTGGRVMDDPGDWVRRELAVAFAAGVRVIPLLINDALLPAIDDLPSDIEMLSNLQPWRVPRRGLTHEAVDRIVAELIALVPELAIAAQATAESGAISGKAPTRVAVSGDAETVHSVAGGLHVHQRPDPVLLSNSGGQIRHLPADTGELIGRASDLARLENAMGESNRVAMVGPDGMGKSILAAQFAHRHAEEFSLVWWVTADSAHAVDAQLAGIASALDPNTSGLSGEQLTDLALEWLATNTGWLLVLDNLTAPADAQPFLARIQTGTVLITSRYRGEWGPIAPLLLDILPPADTAATRNTLRLKREAGDYDVFLCHNVKDKPQVLKIAKDLEARGILPWLDIHEIQPGSRWQQEMARGIEMSRSAAVLIGPSGPGPWHAAEMELINDWSARNRGRRVIPVILEGTEEDPELPGFLRVWSTVDMRTTDPDPIGQLVWGITGQHPRWA